MPHVKFLHNVPTLIPSLSIQHCLLSVSSTSPAKEIGFVLFTAISSAPKTWRR